MKIILRHLNLGLFLIVILASCKKENTINSKCRIIKIVRSSNGVPLSTHNITYNESGMPSSITCSQGYGFYNKKITYGPNTIISLDTDLSEIFLKKDIVTLDNGMVKNIRELRNQDGSQWFNIAIIYGTNGIPVKEIHAASNWQTANEWVYTINNGDIISLNSNGYITSYSFYNDKEDQQGTISWFVSMLAYGVEGYHKNAHLLKSVSGGSVPQLYTYEMNNQGLISRMTQQANMNDNPEITEYTYKCN